jgi:hypothetical protein
MFMGLLTATLYMEDPFSCQTQLIEVYTLKTGAQSRTPI